ncbi:ubiquitin carboxyl-terminal hydrolase [Aspergillus ibericus CBS 121593]|uniref:Cysteine proteinase n=1 Tax=Aspergillus ibericus CBS 121593 TaxID=1448316 RepID=A0A395HAN0_9EURO|nr:cysteine proteinase [Aspergillus ibericus CBS 121593]RAL05001.1 cysteine proteinase [Aspergillus ibericus CBS 121593]
MSLINLPHSKIQERTTTTLTPDWAPPFINTRTEWSGGFHNPDVLCYRNSAILVFLHSPLFLNWLEKYYKAHVSCASESKCLVCGFHELCLAYWGPDPGNAAGFERALVPVWARLRETSWSCAREEQQQDVREFVERVLEELLDETDEEGRRELNEIFKMRTSNDRVCLQCSHVVPMQPDEKFFLVVNYRHERLLGHNTIQELLQTQSRSRFSCGQCKKETEHLLRERLTYLPEIIFVQVNRVSYTNGDLRKNENPVKLADELIIPPEMLNETVESTDGARYEPYGLVFHYGAVPHEGHYTTATKRPKGGWTWFDDDKLEWPDLKTVDEVCLDPNPGAINWETLVYIIAYRRLPLDRSLELGLLVTKNDDSAVQLANDDGSGKSGLFHPPTGDSPGGSPPTPGPNTAESPSPDDVRLDQTIRLMGRKLKWRVEEPLVIPEGYGPLIRIRRGRRVQYAELRLTLTCEATGEILTGKGRISLKPNITRRSERSSSAAAVMNMRDFGTQTSPGPDLKNTAKPQGVTKDKAGSTKPTGTGRRVQSR